MKMLPRSQIRLPANQDKTVKGKGKKPGLKQDKAEPVKEQIQSDRKDELVHDPVPDMQEEMFK